MGKRLETWKVIAAWLHISVRRAQKYASKKKPEAERLPVYRLETNPNAPIQADTDALDAWVQRMKLITSNTRRAG